MKGSGEEGGKEGGIKPMDATRDLWVGLDVSTKGMRELGGIPTRGSQS